jgi:hypothetical protein
VSSDYGNRIIAFEGYNTGATIGTSATLIPLTARVDTTASFNSSTNKYVIPETGYYNVSFLLYTSAVNLTTSQQVEGIVYVNTSNEVILMKSNGTGTSRTHSVSGSKVLFLKQGDTLELNALSGVATTANGSNDRTFMSINKIQSPETLAGGQVVAFEGNNTAGTNIAALAAIPFTAVRDTHNAWSGNTYTVPVSGFYQISGAIFTSAVNNTTSQGVNLDLFVNGVSYLVGPVAYGVGFLRSTSTNIVIGVYLTQGQTIQLHGASSNSVALNTGSNRNKFSILKAG